jgi:hypothetical protein
MDTLTQLFGSSLRVKLMRLFLFNPENIFSMEQISNRVKSKNADIRKEINKLILTGLIKKRITVKEITVRKKKKNIQKRVDEIGYSYDQKFPYFLALKNLLIVASLNADESLVKKFNGIGKIKVFLASGVFLQEWDTRVDLLIVSDDINMVKLDTAIKNLEAEIGKELSYSAFETEDFEYRLGVHDKLVRDILDSKHILLVDKLGLSPKN